MKQYLYSVKDRIGFFSSPYAFMSDENAIRWFGLRCQEKNDLGQVKDDLTLYRVGTIDVETGKIESEDFPVTVASGSDYEVR